MSFTNPWSPLTAIVIVHIVYINESNPYSPVWTLDRYSIVCVCVCVYCVHSHSLSCVCGCVYCVNSFYVCLCVLWGLSLSFTHSLSISPPPLPLPLPLSLSPVLACRANESGKPCRRNSTSMISRCS
jgi:hypothetical protein